MSWRPLVVVGLGSYALYLWHWPLFSLLRDVTDGRPGPQALVAVTLLPAAAALSYLLVERPVRDRVRDTLRRRRARDLTSPRTPGSP